MELNKEQLDLLLAAVQKYFDDTKCQVCGSGDWTPHSIVFELPEFERDLSGRFKGKRAFPVVPVACRVCGNTYFFNAVLLKLFPAGPEPKNGEKQG